MSTPRSLRAYLHHSRRHSRRLSPNGQWQAIFRVPYTDKATSFKMAPYKEVLSFLRDLTSSPSNPASSPRRRTEFDQVLLSNMEQLRNSFVEKGRFLHLQEGLESQINAHVKSDDSAIADANSGVCTKDKSTKDNHEEECKLYKTAVTRDKDSLRWCYVKTCLELLKLLKESLIELKREGEGSGEESAHGKRGNDAPRLPADSLSVGDQKTVLTAIQFVVILGISPNLLPGVGIPLEKRSGFASVLNIQCTIKSERRLFECVDTLVDCVAQPSLGSLVLSRHLGDILSGLIQICYAPVSAYSNANNDTYSNISSSTCCEVNRHSTDDTGLLDESQKSVEIHDSEAVLPIPNSNSSVQLHPYDACKVSCKSVELDGGLFITSVEREKCICNLERILDRVYQPIVIQELLLLQGSRAHASKQSVKDNERSSISGENKKTGGKKQSVLLSQTPKWMTNICGQLLSERLMKPNGVKAVLHGFLEGLAGCQC